MVRMAFFKVDMTALQNVPNLGIFLQLLAAYNEINGLGHLGKLLTSEWHSQRKVNEWTNDKFYESLGWQLYKLRVSSAADGLRNVILEIKQAENNGSMRELWDLIENNVEIAKNYRILEEYLPGPDRKNRESGAGKYYKELAIQLFVRDKMSGHHDKEPLVSALRIAIDKHESAKLPCDGWFQDGNLGEFTRAIFVDNLQVISWYEQNGVETRFSGYDNDPRVKELGEHVDAMLRSFTNFVQELSIAYLNNYKLLKPAGKPEWIKND